MDINEAKIKHLTDLKSVYTHVITAVEGQRTEEDITDIPVANQILMDTESSLKTFCDQIETKLEALGSSNSVVKEALTGIAGVFAGIWNKVRDHETTRALRDLYTALSLCAAATTTLNAFAETVGDQELVAMSLRQQDTLCRLIVKVSEELPRITAMEVAKKHGLTNGVDAGTRSMQNTQKVWKGNSPTVTV